ncbi:MAG TPA: hypothetical protein VM597_35170, partial [Gemmataceae bacterium]|nr:hypothetical protein [Gemmataceae bacterium]
MANVTFAGFENLVGASGTTVADVIATYSLQLLAWGNGSGAPTAGTSLIAVGFDVADALRIRIFDARGTVVTDLTTTNAADTATLRQLLPGLLPPHVPTPAEKTQVITEVARIVGTTLVRDNNDAFVIEGPGSVSGTIDGGARGVDGLKFIDPANEAASQLFNPPGPNSSGTATAYGKSVVYAGLDRVDFFDLSDPHNPVVTGTIFGDSIRIHEDPLVPGGLRVDFAGASLPLSPLQVQLMESLRVDGVEGADTITVESLPPTFGGALFLYGNRLQRTDPSYPKMPEDDPYPDSVIFTGDIALDYLEVFADHVTVQDRVDIATGDSGIFFRTRLVGVSTVENLLPAFATDRSVSVDIGKDAVLTGGNIYFVVQAEDKSFSDVIGVGKEVSNFVIAPLAGLVEDFTALPVKVLVKQSSATITLREGAQLLSGGTIGMYATATADASGKAAGGLFSIGYAQADATAVIDIQKDVVIDAGAAAVVTATGNATANITSSAVQQGYLFSTLNNHPAAALGIGVANANVTSHVTVAAGASITGGKTANVTAQGTIDTSASGEAGLDPKGVAGLGIGIELSNADIHTTVNGSVTALADPGKYTVKNEIDPLLAKSDYTTAQSAFGLKTGKTVELLTEVNGDLPAGTVMKYVGAPVADTVNLAVAAQNYANPAVWEKSTPAVGYVDYATDRIYLGETGLVTEDVVNYTNRRGVSIGNLVNGRTYVLVADASDPGYYWLAETETQAIRASLGYLTNNVVPLTPLGGALATANNDRTFDGTDVDADADKIALPRIAAVNNTFEHGQAVVFRAPSTEFTSGNVLNNTISLPGTIRDFATGDPVTYVGVGIPANTAAGRLEDGKVYYVIAVDQDHVRLSETPGGPAIALSPDTSTAGRTAVRHKLTRAVAGLTDGGTYYVAASTNQTNLQGNTRFTEKQVIGLAELENEARGGVLIDIGPVRGTGYTLSAKHVLDSGFATGVGVVSQLTAKKTASATAGLAAPALPSFGGLVSDVLATNPGNVAEPLLRALVPVNFQLNSSPLAVGLGFAYSHANHSVLTDVGSTAALKSNEDLEVKALITQTYVMTAQADTEAEATVGVGAAVNVGNFNNTARTILHSDLDPSGNVVRAAT